MSAHLLPQSGKGATNSFLLPQHRKVGVAAWFARVCDSVILGLQTLEGRRTLRQLDDRMLSDIGISRCDAEAEATRMPWDLPEYADVPVRR